MTLLSMRCSELRIAVAVIVIVAAVAGPACAQVLTIAQIGDTHLFDPTRTNADIARQELLENHHAFVSAILSINALVSSGTRIDAVALTGGIGINALTVNEVDSRAADVSQLLTALLVRRVLILASESDAAADGSTLRYDAFIAGLRKGLPSFEVVNLEKNSVIVSGVQLVGLNSLPMIARAGGAASAANQIASLEQLKRKLVPARQAIVFTHVPPIKSPEAAAGSANLAVGDGWTLTLAAMPAWQNIVARADILAVFAGHLRVADRARYGKAESLLNDPQVDGWPARLWVAPPLAGPSSPTATETTRGFLVATVASSGTVVTKVHWLSPLESAATAISAPLFKGREHEKTWELDKAITAYEEGLKSTDRSEQAEAQRGFVRARTRMDSWRWWLVQQNAPVLFVFDHATIVFSTVTAIALLLAMSYANPVPLVDPPTKLTSDAPADLFMAEFFAASDEIKHTLRVEQERHLFAAPDAMFLARPSAGDLDAILKDLPAISGINLNTIVAAVRKYVRWFRRRLELQISGTSENAKAFGVLWHAGQTERSWKEPSDASATDVVAVARRMAYNVIWEARNH